MPLTVFMSNIFRKLLKLEMLHSNIIRSYERAHKLTTRSISLKEVRVDRILEGTVGVQEYKNSDNPRSQFKDIPPDCVTQV